MIRPLANVGVFVAFVVLAICAGASANSVFGRMEPRRAPVLASRLRMVEELRELSTGRALAPEAIIRLARSAPAYPTRERLLERFTRERNEARRAAYARALLEIGEPSYERAFVGVFARAGDLSAGIIARALAHYGSKRSIAALVEGLSRARTAGPAEDALVSLGGRAASALLEAAKRDATMGPREAGLSRALGRLGRGDVESLRALARSGDPSLSRGASVGLVFLDPEGERDRAEALADVLTGEDRVRFFLGWLERDPSAASARLTPEDLAEPRVALAAALSPSPALDSVKLELTQLRPGPGGARDLALATLAQSETGRALLSARAPSSDLAAFALAAAHASDAAERDAFIARLPLEEEPLLRALLDPASQPPLPVLYRGLAQSSTFPAAAALLAGRARDAGPTERARYVRALRAGLRSPDVAARFSACMALGALPDADAAPALVRALDDEAPSVRVAAAAALDTLRDSQGKRAILRAARVEVEPHVREALSGRVWESPLGRALLGGEASVYSNVVIASAFE